MNPKRLGTVNVTIKRRGRINTAEYSTTLRSAMVDTDARAILLTDFRESDQEGDLSLPPSPQGFARIHHFRFASEFGWVDNPLPGYPAAQYYTCDPPQEAVTAFLFQTAGCNWRCWYCFVPFEDLTARKGRMVPTSLMVDEYLALKEPPAIIDLSGGQPDLVPEWPIWMVDELVNRGDRIPYVWSDDNLSTDYLFRYVSRSDIQRLAEHAGYGRVGCFKGFDTQSFRFNTKADAAAHDFQFTHFRALLDAGFDMYAYVTLTADDRQDIPQRIAAFVDRLQNVAENLPLRTVPLEVLEWGPVSSRLDATRVSALTHQWEALESWKTELDRRFSRDDLRRSITEVTLQ